MKKCRVCGTVNSDERSVCIGCGGRLTNPAPAEKKRRKPLKPLWRALHWLLVLAVCAGYAVLCVLAVRRTGEYVRPIFIAVLFPVVTYFSVHRPDKMFRVNNYMSVKKGEEPSDFYTSASRIGGVILLCAGVVLLLALYFEAA